MIHLAVKFDAGGGLEDIKFTGRGCAISQASASLCDEIEGKVGGSAGNAPHSTICDQ
jgi:NifU-like protein involved in Fe-S cluster formation